jgi:hypothetical protein
MDFPTLVTTGLAGTAPQDAGVFGTAGTQTLLGQGDLDNSGQSGVKITAEWALCPDNCRGLEFSYFGLDSSTSSFSMDSFGNSILARPVFDTETNSEAATLVGFPNLTSGSILVEASTELQGGEFLFRRAVADRCDTRLDLMFGYRYGQLEERLGISQSTEWIGAQSNVIPGTTQDLFDEFNTNVEFHGGELGLAYNRRLNCWVLDVTMKVAFGQNRSEVSIDGRTVNSVPGGGSATFGGGLLAQQTNAGTYEDETFGIIPELGVRLNRDLTERLRFSVGYNLFYWTKVLRPGDLIDREVSQFPPEDPRGTEQPAVQFEPTTFAAQGLSLGLKYKF